MSCCVAGLALVGGRCLGVHMPRRLLLAFMVLEITGAGAMAYAHREHIAEVGHYIWRQLGVAGSTGSAAFESTICSSR